MKKAKIYLAIVVFVFVPITPAFAHGPDQAPHQSWDLGRWFVEGGGGVENLRMSYVTHGNLNEAKDNAILVLHGFGGNHHGWDFLIGPGKALDTDKYYIIASDSLGCTQTGFEHSTSPTSTGLKMDFPAYNLRDMVYAEYCLVKEGLGIRHLRAVAGYCMGAVKALQFGISYPGFTDGIISLAGGALWSSQGDQCQMLLQSIIETSAGWNGGDYGTNPQAGAAAALWSQAPLWYSPAWWKANITSAEALETWREGLHTRYVGLQDARDLYYMSKALERVNHQIATNPGCKGDLTKALGAIRAQTLFIACPQDQYYPQEQIEMQHRAVPNSKVVYVDSSAGHFICTGADPQATQVMGEAIGDFLERLAAER